MNIWSSGDYWGVLWDNDDQSRFQEDWDSLCCLVWCNLLLGCFSSSSWFGESCGDFILALTWLKKDSKMSLFDLELFQLDLISSDVLIAGAILGSIWIMLFFLALWDYPGWPEISSRVRIRCSLSIGTCHFWVLSWSLSYLFV